MDIYHSSEIRWFSKSKEPLKSIYDALPGSSTEREERTDLYLKSLTTNTGVKIREGKHEIKVKNSPDYKTLIGNLEDWTKWSSFPTHNILNLVDRSVMNDWLKIKKTRIKKQYEIIDERVIHNNDKIHTGCGIEFTKVEVISDGNFSQWYTYGLEAFGNQENCRECLELILEKFNQMDTGLDKMICMSYPSFLATLNS